MYITAAAMTTENTAAMTMPAITPGFKPWGWSASTKLLPPAAPDVEVGVGEPRVRVDPSSGSKNVSPGLNSWVAFWLNSCCMAKVCVEFGLITPTIPMLRLV